MGNIQKEIDKLRENGTTKVVEYQSLIEMVKGIKLFQKVKKNQKYQLTKRSLKKPKG